MLLDRGADINQTNRYGTSSLYIACQKGHTEVASMLLDRGAGVNKASTSGKSSLFFASRSGHKELALMLLDRGADIKQATNDGWSSLRTACFNRHTDIAAMLIERGADDDGALFAAEDEEGILPTWRAARSLVASDIRVADSLLSADPGGGLLLGHLPLALASTVKEYVFCNPSYSAGQEVANNRTHIPRSILTDNAQ
jgi:ankyrin repeat protein